MKTIEHDGHKLFLDEKSGEVREPRFDMPFKEPYENDRIRIIKRTGHFQVLLEIYFKNDRHSFRAIRVDKTDKDEVIFLDEIFYRHMKSFSLTKIDMLPIGFKEYKANWNTGTWIKTSN